MINTSRGTSEYQIQAISNEVLIAFSNASESLLHFKNGVFPTMLKTLECFLQLTNQTLDMEQLKSSKFQKVAAEYVGSIYSKNVFDITQKRKYDLLKSFELLSEILHEQIGAFPITRLPAHLKKTTPEIDFLVQNFEKLTLDKEKLWEWERWPCKTKRGKTYWAPLLPIYKRLGKEFTNRLYEICKEYSLGRRNLGIPCLKSLSTYIGQYEGELIPENLQNGSFMTVFWRDFLTYHMSTEFADGDGVRVSTLISEWRCRFLSFVESYLVGSKLVARVFGAMPSPPPLTLTGDLTNVKTGHDGTVTKIKLLTNVPIYISDEEAMHKILKQIQTDVDIAVNWATLASEKIWANYKQRLALSEEGSVYKLGGVGTNNGNYWLKNRQNPDHLKNAAATLMHYGHVDELNVANKLFPSPLSQTATELGMPTSGSLLPFCTLLVVNHPAITTSFLENLELYDKNCKLVGLQELDGTYKLVGYKMRRGPALAEQKITLNEQTHALVRQIISLTSSLREHLKKKGDDNWRYLLLTSKQGFGYPTRVKAIAADTCMGVRGNEFAKSLKSNTDLTYAECLEYATNFDITSLRASCAVLVYLKTKSIKAMSEALGHAALDHKLIRRYLPDVIHSFFQERWIRIFQTGIIVEAMRDSSYILEATSFQSFKELDLFLQNHALKLPPDRSAFSEAASSRFNSLLDQEIIFGVNTQILTVLISLQLAVKAAQSSIHELAHFWAEFSTYLLNFLESNASNRPDFQDYIRIAKSKADPSLVSSIIYA